MKTQILLVCGLAVPVSLANASALLKPTSGVTQALSAKTLDVQTRISGAFAQTTITTTYANPNDTRIEADFLYSAPKNSVVTGFSYWFGDEKVVARVVEKKRAAKIYQYITSRMRDPALIEMVGKNLFRAKIFPIEARSDLKIEIKLAQTLPATKNGALWSYPLTDETRGAAALQKVRLRARFANPRTRAKSNIGALKNGVLDWQASDFRARSDWRLSVPQTPAPLRASIYGARDGGSDGFFALSLVSAQNIKNPRPQFSGAVYGLRFSTQRVRAGQAFFVFGRYRKSGATTVSLGGKKAVIVFPAAREAGNVAARLWAAEEIEALSTREANRDKVMALSKRFGVPSKWTSWLAIPVEERERMAEMDKEEKRQARYSQLSKSLGKAGESYAEAVASDQPELARKQKIVLENLEEQLSAFGRDKTAGASYLDWKLRDLSYQLQSARLQNASNAEIARLEIQIARLGRAGAKEGADFPRELAKDEMKVLAQLLTQEIEENRADGEKAVGLRARLEEVESGATKRGWHFDRSDVLSQKISSHGEKLARQIGLERAKVRPDASKIGDLRTRLARLVAGYPKERNHDPTGWFKSLEQEALYEVFRPEIERLAGKLAEEIALRRENGPRGQALNSQLAAMEQRTGHSYGDYYITNQAWRERAQDNANRLVFDEQKLAPTRKRELSADLEKAARNVGAKANDYLANATTEKLRDPYNATADALVKEILAGREEGATARALHQKVEKLKAKSNDWWQQQAIQFAYSGRAHQLAYQIEAEVAKKGGGDADKIRAWEKQLARVAPLSYYGGRRNSNDIRGIRAQERTRVASAQGPVKVEDYATRVVGLNPNNARSSYGGGDPLLCIDAAADAQKVVAILPDGSIKNLEYRPQTRRWEANFDIPWNTSGGDYFVTLIIVEKSGARHQIKLRYRVDSTKPNGKIEWKNRPSGVELSILADDDVTRVTAFAPWGQRYDLRRDASGAFSKRVEIPADFGAISGEIRFVLLDGAHNRTEISVDWTK